MATTEALCAMLADARATMSNTPDESARLCLIGITEMALRGKIDSFLMFATDKGLEPWMCAGGHDEHGAALTDAALNFVASILLGTGLDADDVKAVFCDAVDRMSDPSVTQPLTQSQERKRPHLQVVAGTDVSAAVIASSGLGDKLGKL